MLKHILSWNEQNYWKKMIFNLSPSILFWSFCHMFKQLHNSNCGGTLKWAQKPTNDWRISSKINNDIWSFCRQDNSFLCEGLHYISSMLHNPLIYFLQRHLERTPMTRGWKWNSFLPPWMRLEKSDLVLASFSIRAQMENTLSNGISTDALRLERVGCLNAQIRQATDIWYPPHKKTRRVVSNNTVSATIFHAISHSLRGALRIKISSLCMIKLRLTCGGGDAPNNLNAYRSHLCVCVCIILCSRRENYIRERERELFALAGGARATERKERWPCASEWLFPASWPLILSAVVAGCYFVTRHICDSLSSGQLAHLYTLLNLSLFSLLVYFVFCPHANFLHRILLSAFSRGVFLWELKGKEVLHTHKNLYSSISIWTLFNECLWDLRKRSAKKSTGR